MKLACTSRAFASALDRGDLTQLEMLDLASRELGVDGVVLDVRHFPRTDDDYLAQVKKMATDLGLCIAALESDDFFTRDPASSRTALEIALRVGAPLLAAPLATETALAWSVQLAHLSEAAAAAKAVNVTLALRNAPGTYAATALDCKRASKETDSAWLRYGLEPAAFDAASDVASLAGRTVLLWSADGAAPEPLLAEWAAYQGFVALTRQPGDASIAEMKNAIRRWRIAQATFELNRT
jgi:sugar phosphate isomerase/epimerase